MKSKVRSREFRGPRRDAAVLPRKIADFPKRVATPTGPVRVVWVDDSLLVVDKPAGLSSQSEEDDAPDLVATLAAFDRQVRPIHRLDRPASGLVLFGRSQVAAAKLSEALQQGEIGRTYLAVASGMPATPQATWDRELDGEHAVTHVTWLSSADGLSTARLQLDTGRFHQIRRHASAAGHALLGDRRYGGDAAGWWPRLALHACTLEFIHPVTGAALRFHAPLPPDLRPLWAQAGGPDLGDENA
jgi:23S rRNA-/tRNA-specific pseudouridylate synthase